MNQALHESLMAWLRELGLRGEPYPGDQALDAYARGFTDATDLLEGELCGLRAFKRGVDEALNSGDGTYRP